MNIDWSQLTDITQTPAYKGDITLYPELLNYSALNPFVRAISSSRVVMYTGNMGQWLLVNGLGPTGFYTGLEKEYGEATVKVAFKHDATVLRTIERYPRTMAHTGVKNNPQTIVFYEDESLTVHMLDLRDFSCTHQQFGFMFEEVKENMDRLYPGAKFAKGSVLLKSPSVQENGDYYYTVPVETAFASDPAGTEDGLAMDAALVDDLTPTGFGQRTIMIGPDEFLINQYGSEKKGYMGLPDVGDKVLPNGLLAAIRQYDPIMAVTNMTMDQVMSVDHDFDRSVYAEPEATILNIRVTKGRDAGRLPRGMEEQLEAYVERDRVFFRSILDFYYELRSQRRNTLKLAPPVIDLVTEALATVGRDYVTKNGIRPLDSSEPMIDIIYRNQKISGWRIDIDYSYNPVPNKGFKLSDKSGGKGILSAIRKTENMYIDEYGNRVGMVWDDLSTIRRLNPSRFYEQYIAASRRDTRKRALQMAGIYPDLMTRPKPKTPEEKHELFLTMQAGVAAMSDAKVDEVYNYILGFLAIVSPLLLVKINKHYPKMYPDNYKRVYITECFATRIEVEFPADNPIDFIQATTMLREQYPALMTRLSWVDPITGKTRTTKDPILVGEIDIMVLEKTAEGYSAVNSAKLQHYGTPARLTNYDKHSAPGRLQPNKTMDETGYRSQVAYCGGEYVADYGDAANNPTAHRHINMRILESEQPTNLDVILDRNVIPKGGHRPKSLYAHISECAGRSITNEPVLHHLTDELDAK